MWCVTQYITVNLNINSICSHPTGCLLYVVDQNWGVPWRRKQMFLYENKLLQSTRFGISVSRCSVAIYCTDCTGYLKQRVLQNQIPFDHIEADICIPAAERIKTAARLYLKTLNNMLCWCGGFERLCANFYKFWDFSVLMMRANSTRTGAMVCW